MYTCILLWKHVILSLSLHLYSDDLFRDFIAGSWLKSDKANWFTMWLYTAMDRWIIFSHYGCTYSCLAYNSMPFQPFEIRPWQCTMSVVDNAYAKLFDLLPIEVHRISGLIMGPESTCKMETMWLAYHSYQYVINWHLIIVLASLFTVFIAM